MTKKRMNKITKGLILTFALTIGLLTGCKGAEEPGVISEGTVTLGVSNSDNRDVPPEPTVTPEATPTAEPTTPTEAPSVIAPKLPEYTLVVENELYFEFRYAFENLTCRSENEEIAGVTLMEGEYDFEEQAETTGAMIYGIANGETELVVADVKSGQEVRWKVTVEKPEVVSGKQDLIDYLLKNGETNDLGDKVITKGTPESGGQATVEYATMDKNINFYFNEEQGETKLEWNLIPTPEENTEYYITMRVAGEFVTATVDLATYDGATLVFEKGWFRVPVEDDLQKTANEASGRAYEEVRTLLYEKTGMTMGDVVR